MNDNKMFATKSALIIGGSSSIGFELAKLLKEYGCNVIATGRNPEHCEAAGINFIEWDLKNPAINEESFIPVKPYLDCDILAVCYGPFVQKPLHSTTAQDWILSSCHDYALPGILISSVLPNMIRKNFGRILLFGGTRTDSVKAYKTNTAYSGAKTGVSVIVKSVASEYARNNITCNAIFPGFTNNAPLNTEITTENAIAKQGLNLLLHEELNGVLLNIDRGWTPQN